jgi:hypothetical protein
MNFRELSEFRQEIKTEKRWDTYDILSKRYRVNKFYLWKILNQEDYSPPPSVCKILGIAVISEVQVVSGSIPPGSQSLGASYCIRCGKPFIPNHPRRRKCFTCSPPRASLPPSR